MFIFINIMVYRNLILKDLLYDKVIVLIIILVLSIFIIVVTTVTLRKISCITLHWKCSVSVRSHLCLQGYSKAPATSMCAGSPLIFRGVIWSLAPGRMEDGLWTCRWLMLTSQDILQMESGTLWVGWYTLYIIMCIINPYAMLRIHYLIWCSRLKVTNLLKIACKSLIMLYYHQILYSVFLWTWFLSVTTGLVLIFFLSDCHRHHWFA